MSTVATVKERFTSIEGVRLLQVEPYPVVSPASVDAVRAVVEHARTEHLKVLPLGTGSSFSENFTMNHSNVVAILMSRLKQVEQVTPFSVRILAGTPVETILNGYPYERRTLGGLLADSSTASSFHWRCELSSSLRSLEVLCSDGALRTFHCEAGLKGECASEAFSVLGSSGRMGCIVAAEFRAPLPIQINDPESSVEVHRTIAGHREVCLWRSDLIGILDPVGLFQW